MIFLHVNQIILGFNMTCSSTVDKSWWHLKWWWSEWSRWSTTSPIANVIGNECLYSLYIVSLDPRVLLIGACQVFPNFPSLLGVIINTPFDLDVYIQTKSQKPRKCIQPSPRKTTTFRMVIFHIFPLPWAPGHWMSLRQWQAWSASQRQGALRSAGDGDRGFTMQNAGISSFFLGGGI